MNHDTLASLIDRTRLQAAGVALFTRDLRIPLRAVTALPLPLERLFGEAYRPALHQRVRSLYFLGIVTDEAFETDLELPAATAATAASPQPAVDSAVAETAKADYEGMVILLADLEPRPGDKMPTRSELCDLTRSCNRAFHGTPVAVLFRYDGDGKPHAALANCERTQYRQTWRDGEKPGRVSLLRDIDLRTPHPGHLRILNDLRVERAGRHAVATFKALHEQWRRVFDVGLLNKAFYERIASLFYNLVGGAVRTGHETQSFDRLLHLPSVAPDDVKTHQEFAVRIIGRIIFCWFLKHKGASSGKPLLPPSLISSACAKATPNYYHDILERLFFQILNTPCERRGSSVIEGAEQIPFLNGGLFEPHPGDFYGSQFVNTLRIPDTWFAALFEMLESYYFTISESTPVDAEVAVDPEILGRIFENLLAEINPETGETARKQTGSFYTPREIVDYMVVESLANYLDRKVPQGGTLQGGISRLDTFRALLGDGPEQPFAESATVQAIIDALGEVKILDPACGSGAFPMGALHRIVHTLRKLDPVNEAWKRRQLREAEAISDRLVRSRVLAQIEDIFATEQGSDYGRKLYLIQNCIYGVDVQPVAVEISKLRFFLSLIVDEKIDDAKPNRGIEPLPNLEFKFVAANTLIPLTPEYSADEQAFGLEDPFFAEFARLTHDYFAASEPQAKHDIRLRIETLVKAKTGERFRQITALHHKIRIMPEGAAKRKQQAMAEQYTRDLELWESYPNLFGDEAVKFFELKYFFPDAADGFDVAIGNPPYVRADEQSEWNQTQRQAVLASGAYETLWEKWDLFVAFIERAYKLLKPGGVSSLIVSDGYCHAKYAQKSQNWFLRHARILRLDFLADLKVFDAAVHNMIYFYERTGHPDANRPERRRHDSQFDQVANLPTDEQRNLTYRAFFPETADAAPAPAFTCPTLTLAEVCYVSFGCRPNSDEKQAKGLFVVADLLSDICLDSHPKPYIEAKEMGRWTYCQSRWLEWGTDRSPKLLARATFEELYEVPEKIVVADVSGAENRAAYDSNRVYHSHTLISVVPWHSLCGVRNRSLQKSARYADEKPRIDLPSREDLESTSRRFAVKYLLAVMNSSVARDFLRANRRSNIHLYPDDWKKLPIPDIAPERQAPIVALVDRILAAKRANPAADIASLEAQVDAMVVELYGVSQADATTADKPLPVEVIRHAGEEFGLKLLLQREVLQSLRQRGMYFSVQALRKELDRREIEWSSATLNRYMIELTEGKFIWSAGRGWYSFLDEPFHLETHAVEEFVGMVEKRYPLLDFSCWSTFQINPFMHHMLGKPVVFIHLTRDAMSSIFDCLRDAGYNAYLNPNGREAEKFFTVTDKTVVVRPSTVKYPVAGHMATIEKILVDLYVELDSLPLMDIGEYQNMLCRVALSGRIDMASLVSYAKYRSITPENLFQSKESIISDFSKILT